jgi:hypothetical protein
VVAGQANVRVWIDGGDVFPGYRDVTIWVRADRDCYSTLFLVDTAGYIHVLYPFQRHDDGWISGGHTYRYRACDLGLDRLDGRGVAYVFAVGSPAPFDYGCYGEDIFVGRFGFRIVGDPFVACRTFYMSLLPAGCRWDYVGVGFTRFYLREWVRYPSYLCYGGSGVHVRIGEGCRVCADVYASYRCNAASPWEAISPAPRYKQNYRANADIRRSTHAAAPRDPREAYARPAGERAPVDRRAAAGRDEARKYTFYQDRSRVVSTSKASEGVGRQGRTNRASSARELARSDSRGAHDQLAVRGPVGKGAREKGAKKRVRQAE